MWLLSSAVHSIAEATATVGNSIMTAPLQRSKAEVLWDHTDAQHSTGFSQSAACLFSFNKMLATASYTDRLWVGLDSEHKEATRNLMGAL